MKIGTLGIAAIGALSLFGAAPASAGDFSLSVRLGEVCAPTPRVVTRTVVLPSYEPRCDYYAYAGTLTIDGRDFVIETSRNIASQFVEAFRCMGYWASSDGWNIRVNRSLSGPQVCWRSGDYCLDISKDCDQIFLKPTARSCDWSVELDWSWDWDHGCYRDTTYRYRYCSSWWEPRYHRGYSIFFHIGSSSHDHDRHDGRFDRHDRDDRRWDWREHRNDLGRDRHDHHDGQGGRDRGWNGRDRHDRRDHGRDDGVSRYDGRTDRPSTPGRDAQRDNDRPGRFGNNNADNTTRGGRDSRNDSRSGAGRGSTERERGGNARADTGRGSSNGPDRTGGRDATAGKAVNPMNPRGKDFGPQPTVERPRKDSSKKKK